MKQHIKYNVRSPILPVANGISRFLHRVTFELIISKRLKAQVNYHFTLVEMFEIVKKTQKTPQKNPKPIDIDVWKLSRKSPRE